MPMRPKIIAPEEVVAFEQSIASCSRSTSLGRLFVSADVSTDFGEDQGQFQGDSK